MQFRVEFGHLKLCVVRLQRGELSVAAVACAQSVNQPASHSASQQSSKEASQSGHQTQVVHESMELERAV